MSDKKIQINSVDSLRFIIRDLMENPHKKEYEIFNIKYNYSEITDMSHLWEKVENILKSRMSYDVIKWDEVYLPFLNMKNVIKRDYFLYGCKVSIINIDNTENIESLNFAFSETNGVNKIKLNLKNCLYRNSIFEGSSVEDIELKETEQILELNNGFKNTRNLKKINELNLNNCLSIDGLLFNSSIKDISIKGTRNIKKLLYTFKGTKFNSLVLDGYNLESLQFSCVNSSFKNLVISNCKNLKNLNWFIQGNQEIKFLELNLSNVDDCSDFIDEKNKIEFLKIIGLEKYVNNHINFLKKNNRVEQAKELEFLLKDGIDIKRDFHKIFFKNEDIQEYYKKNPIKKISSVIQDYGLDGYKEKIENRFLIKCSNDRKLALKLEHEEKLKIMQKVKKVNQEKKQERVSLNFF